MSNEKYDLRNRTPESDCIGGIGCPAIYELTPKELQCIIGGCPSIYELTPKELLCCVGACSTIYSEESSYLIVGKQVSTQQTKELGLERKVGEGEVLISVPRALIDNMGK